MRDLVLEEGRVECGSEIPIWRPFVDWAVRGLVLGAAYYLGSMLGHALAFPGSYVSVIWPPNAILLVGLLCSPARRWPWLLLIVFPVHILAQAPYGESVLLAGLYYVYDIILVLATAGGLRWCGLSPLTLGDLRQTLLYLLVTTVAIAVCSLVWSPLIVSAWDMGGDRWLQWRLVFLSNLIPFFIAVPGLMIGMNHGIGYLPGVSPKRWLESSLLALGLLACGIFAFRLKHEAVGNLPMLLYAPLPFMLWAAVRFGPGGLSISFLLFSLMASFNSVAGHGPFVTQSAQENVLWLQIFLLALYVPLLVLASVVQERRSKEEALKESEARYRGIVEDQAELICRFLPDGTLTFVNDAYCRYFKRTPQDLVGRTFWPLIPAEAHAACRASLASLTPNHPVFTCEHEVLAPGNEIRWQQWTDRGFFDADGRVVAYQAVGRDITELKRAEQSRIEQLHTVEVLNRTGSALAAELDLEKLVQAVTDAGTELTGADFGAFFYNVWSEAGESYMLYTISGAPREAFAKFPMPRNTSLFAPTFKGEGVVRSDDITKDPRYGSNAPHNGMPAGHLPVRSYLAAPVIARSGKVLGALFFGHPEVGVFTDRAERIVVGIAAQASIAIDNARLYQQLKHSESRLRQSMEAGRMGTWELNIATNAVTLSGEVKGLYGTPAAAFARTLSAFEAGIHHDDRSRVANTLHQAIAQRKDHHIEFRIVGADGKPRWIEMRNQILLNERDEPVRVFGICTDITDRKRAEEEHRQLLAQQRVAEALRETDRRKDEFLAMLGHELRNPLAPIETAVEVLRRQPTADEATQVYDVIGRQVKHMTRLVDDLLDVSRITRGQVRLKMEPLDLETVVAQAVETSRPLITIRRHELSIDLTPPMRVYGDAVRLAQVISNLLNNAARYTDEGGRIDLAVRRDDSNVVVRVRDNGEGIAPDMLDKVFGLFVQVDPTRGRVTGGLGIGLTLVKRLVEMHGGAVEARSDGLGQGSEFVVRLPALVETPAEPVADEGEQTGPPPPARKRILVVDDNVDAAVLLARILELESHEVRIAHDGHAGLEAAKAFQPDVVLLDISLPGMDGLEVARRLRVEMASRQPLLVAISGFGQDEDFRRTDEAGFDQLLVKPIEPGQLIGLIASASPATATA